MKVAMISPLEMKVPPIGYGGVLVVSLLTEEVDSVESQNYPILAPNGPVGELRWPEGIALSEG